MSNPTFLLSKLIPFAISTDGANFKNVVCKKLYGFDLNVALVQEETDCGIATGVGATKFGFNFDAVYNSTPNAGEVSANEIAGYALNNTLVYVKVSNGGYVRSGSGYITAYKETAAQGSFIAFSATFTGNGLPALA